MIVAEEDRKQVPAGKKGELAESRIVTSKWQRT